MGLLLAFDLFQHCSLLSVYCATLYCTVCLCRPVLLGCPGLVSCPVGIMIAVLVTLSIVMMHRILKEVICLGYVCDV